MSEAAMHDSIEYEEAKRLARHADADVRRRLAARTDVRAEILYYLAEDQAPEVRREIAANAKTPRQADLLLARDRDEEVRYDLACKIARLAPSLSAEQREAVRQATVEVIEVLARDQATRIRRTLAEALKELPHAPPAVVGRLARDVEVLVAAPVLQFSPLLSDRDLLEIIASRPVRGALAAIARRNGVTEGLSEAIVGAGIETGESPAIAALLDNPSAQIREETLDRILAAAPSEAEWHAPLARRPWLPAGAVKRLAGFIARSLLDQLASRPDLDPETARQVARTVEMRLAAEEEESGPPGEAPAERPLEGAIAAGDRRAVVRGLAHACGFDALQIEKILDSQSAKGVTALAWKAGLPMRQAVQLQLRIAGIPPRAALNPRGGTEYPMTPEEMGWQIDFFTGLG